MSIKAKPKIAIGHTDIWSQHASVKSQDIGYRYTYVMRLEYRDTSLNTSSLIILVIVTLKIIGQVLHVKHF